LGVKSLPNPFAVRVSKHLPANPSTARVSEHLRERLCTSLHLTMTLTFCYTNSMIKQLKKNGLLDKDFLQGISMFLLPVVLKVLGVA